MKIRKKVVLAMAVLAMAVLVMTFVLTACGSCDACGSSGEITTMYGVTLPMPVPCVMCN